MAYQHVTLNSPGIKALLKSAGVDRVLLSKGGQVAGAASARTAEEVFVNLDTDGPNRHRVAVVLGGFNSAANEAANRVLGSSLPAARG